MDDLIAKIECAFSDGIYPGDKDLTDSTYGEEPRALVKEFRGKSDWKSLSADFLNQAPDGWGTAISFFSSNAFRFYLPAYLIADVSGELTGNCDPAVRLCSSVTPLGGRQKIAKMWGGGTMGDRARETFGKFNAAEVSAIVDYLMWKLDRFGGFDPTIEQALENYWLEWDEALRK